MAPGGQIEIEAVADQAVAFALVDDVAQEIAKLEALPGEPRHAEGDVALTLNAAVVHHREQPALALLPRRHDELFVRAVARPGRPAALQAPFSFANLGPPETAEEEQIEGAQVLIDGLRRAAPEVHRDVSLAPLELTFVDEAE